MEGTLMSALRNTIAAAAAVLVIFARQAPALRRRLDALVEPTVIKFGGTSVATATRIREAAKIAKSTPGCSWIVVSAPGKRTDEDAKITDLLILMRNLVRGYDAERDVNSFADILELIDGVDNLSVDTIWTLIAERYSAIARDLGVEIGSVLEQVRHVIMTVENDHLAASCGEYIQAIIVGSHMGWKVIDAAELIVTDEHGIVDMPASCANIRARCSGDAPGYVIAGFRAAMLDGTIRTLGRGGSDITMVVMAAALRAIGINSKDVTAIYDADPRTDASAQPIPRMDTNGFVALHERTGTGVVHIRAIRMAGEHDVTVQVRESRLDAPVGTTIVPVKPLPIVA